MKAPCMNCPDREIGCHGHCERYKEFRAGREKEYALRHEQYVLDIPSADLRRKSRRKLLQKLRHGR
jgi:hypothetical protein